MQSPAKETCEISLTELPRALEDYRNPSYQNHTPQFDVSGGIYSVFQYTAPKTRSQQTNKPLTPTPTTLTTPIKQRAF